ncbi:hypothetical protein [Acinetobacter sp. TGL-Y2]|uniref:hypothetical protein n=1 Tax=Acinetobacter sp. TGL-Y2 TaxID=1407071 RepID=UPI000A6166BD|nr:hypothetical protein [Acinetobacter sp. TGL-Y2]
MAKISHIAKNMKIKKIGSLFKKHNSGSWAINLALEDENKVPETTSTNFSNAKLLRKKVTSTLPKNILKATIYALKLVQFKIGYPLSIIQTYPKESL